MATRVLQNVVRNPNLPYPEPVHANGSRYAHLIIHQNEETRVYADTMSELCEELIPNYDSTAEVAQAFRRRYRYTKDLQVRMQALINTQYRDELAASTPTERSIATGPRIEPIIIPPDGVWRSHVPLVLIETEYGPPTNLIRPTFDPANLPPDGHPPLIWLNPLTEETLLHSLALEGVIAWYRLPKYERPRERSAPAHPHDPERGTGIAWHPDHLVLWEQGLPVMEFPHQTTSPWDCWWRMAFAEVFPFITHWWFQSAWIGWVKIATITHSPQQARGTIKFIDDSEDPQPWTAVRRTTSDPWIFQIPLPPFETGPNVPLRVTLAYNLHQHLADAANAKTDWFLATGMGTRNGLNAFATTLNPHWRLHDAPDVPLRVALLQSLGLTPPARNPDGKGGDGGTKGGSGKGRQRGRHTPPPLLPPKRQE